MLGRQHAEQGGARGKSLRRRPELREALAYCVPLGLPLSEFLSWDEADQDHAIAYRRELALIHEPCGTRLDEWEGAVDPYEARSVVCRGCVVMAEERERRESDGSKPGLVVFLTPDVAEDDD